MVVWLPSYSQKTMGHLNWDETRVGALEQGLQWTLIMSTAERVEMIFRKMVS